MVPRSSGNGEDEANSKGKIDRFYGKDEDWDDWSFSMMANARKINKDLPGLMRKAATTEETIVEF